MLNQCCYIGCTRLAEYEIRENTCNVDNIYACQKHVTEMLSTTEDPACESWTVNLYNQSDGHKSWCATHNMPAYPECNCQLLD